VKARPAGKRPLKRLAGQKHLKYYLSILILAQKVVFLPKQAVYNHFLYHQPQFST
jgi:hypothetical protein